MNSLMKKIIGATAIAGLVTFASISANATIIFQDNFNRANNNNVGNGWLEVERNNKDVAISSNRLRLRDKGPQARASIFESTAGYKDIFIDFAWRATDRTERADDLYLDWYNGTNWANAWTTTLGGSPFASVSVGEIIGADDLSAFGFRFRTVFNGRVEQAFINNVVLRGTAVPAPGSLALLGLGLAGLGFSRRKKA